MRESNWLRSAEVVLRVNTVSKKEQVGQHLVQDKQAQRSRKKRRVLSKEGWEGISEHKGRRKTNN